MQEATNNEQQQKQQEQRGTTPPASAFVYHSMPLAEKIKYGLYVGIPTGLGLEVLGASATGLVLAAAAGMVAGYWSEEIRAGILDRLPAPRKESQSRASKLRWLLTGQSAPPSADTQDDEEEDDELRDEEDEESEEDEPEEPDEMVQEPVQKRQQQRQPQTSQKTPPRKGPPVMLAPDLSIPLGDIAGKAIFIAGIRRSGKTTLGALLAEQFGRYYIPLFIPCFEGDYLSLADVLPRALVAGHPSADAQYSDYDFVAITHANAANLGYNLLELGYQVILDLASYPRLEEGIAAQIQVIRGMFKWAELHPDQRTTSYVYLDEAQRYLPENLRESVIDDKFVLEGLFKVYKDIIAIGGKRGISPVVLTQRFAQVNKKIMAQVEVYFLMRQTSDNDLARCMDYVKQSTATQEAIAKFRTGQGVYIAADGEQRVVQFNKRRSDDTRSRTPRPDEAQRYAQMPMRLPRYQHAEEEDVPTEEQSKPLAHQTTQPQPQQESQQPVQEPTLPKAIVPEKGPKAEDIDLAVAIDLWNKGYNSERKLMKVFRLNLYQAGLLRDKILEQAHSKTNEEEVND